MNDSDITLRKRLNEKGLLASIDLTRETLTVRRRIAGEYVAVLHLQSDALMPHSRMTAGDNYQESDQPHEEFRV
jgi:hypothetical protein